MKPVKIKRWMPLALAITGYLVPLLFVVFGVLYGVVVENRTSGDGLNKLVWAGLYLLPLCQIAALVLGVLSWRRMEGKMGAIAALMALLFYAYCWLRL
jgi:Na+/proline symporter